MVDQNLLNDLYTACFDRHPDPGAQGYIGKPADTVLHELLLSPEYNNRQKSIAQAIANAALVPELQKQITDLKATPTPVIPATSDPAITVTQSGLWAAFKRILGIGG